MLSYDQALEKILAAANARQQAPSEEIELTKSLEYALAADVFASVALPPFDNTAIDGFAVRQEDTVNASPESPTRLRIIETIAAGQVPTQTVGHMQASRILTGAPLPLGADSLVMVEDTRPAPSDMVDLLLPGSPSYIRRRGSDLPVGAPAVSAGAEIDVGTIALLAALGMRTAPCRRRPRVAVLSTGDELRLPGENGPLPFGSIYNSNGPALVAAVEQAGGTVPLQHQHVSDDPAAIREALRGASECDVIITSGGVSVGEFDYVKAAVEEMGSLDFWRIAIKPGKPLAFGSIGSALFFGLPG
ncbi:MAG: molybdopterin molybdotransferase MoeA, partial [Armatimonadota bacterium]